MPADSAGAPAPGSRGLESAGSLALRPETLRLAGLAVALAALWGAFAIATGGLFLSPRNLQQLAVQASATAIMAAGMVVVLAARHVDLSVGSVLGFAGMAIAWLQVEALPPDAAWSAPASALAGVALGLAIGAWQGLWVAYAGLPAFVVTLAGLLMFRGAAYLVSDGRTLAPLDAGYQRLGGGAEGSIGATASWILALAVAALFAARTLRVRAARGRLGVARAPAARDALRIALAAAAALGLAALANAWTDPRTGAARGFPIPLLLLAGIAAGTSQLVRARRFGRHVLALGGSPEAAALAGIDVRRVVLASFALSGGLAGVAAVLTTARLGAGAVSMGTLAELQVIAAAVLGGTSLAGGVANVGGAVLGALLMQSLENGLLLLGASSASRQIASGAILMAAVWADTAWRRRRP